MSEATAWNSQRDMPHFHPRRGMVRVQTEHPLVKAFEDLLAQLRWHLDALREWCLRLGMGMKEHRLDPDYDASENDVRLLRRAIEQLVLSKPSGNNYYNGANDNRTLNWILGILGTLLVSGVIGGIAMYGKLNSIEEGQRGHERRIDRLERLSENRYRSSTD